MGRNDSMKAKKEKNRATLSCTDFRGRNDLEPY